MLKAVVFDLDGTIGNTLPLCVAAFRQAIQPLAGRSLTDREIVATFGPSEEGTIMELLPGHYDEGVRRYLDYYRELHGMCPRPFAGIGALIGQLKEAGLIVAMVTGKGEKSCSITLAQYGMAHLFDRIETGWPHGPRKKEGLKAVLDAFGLEPENALYVGDAPSDIAACRAVGVPIAVAAWAETTDAEELKKMNPDKMFFTVGDFAADLLARIRTG